MRAHSNRNCWHLFILAWILLEGEKPNLSSQSTFAILEVSYLHTGCMHVSMRLCARKHIVSGGLKRMIFWVEKLIPNSKALVTLFAFYQEMHMQNVLRR